MKRQSYQKGCVSADKRRGTYRFHWRDANGKPQSKSLGRCATKAEAWRKAAPLIQGIGGEQQTTEQGITVSQLVKEYVQSDRFPARFSTRQAYTYNLENWIVPKWGSVGIGSVKPYACELWLKSLGKSSKTQVHLRSLMRVLIDYAMHREYLPTGRNPMELVRIAGATKRETQPAILTVQEFNTLLSQINTEPQRSMILTAMFLGLRFSELTALKWCDLDVLDHKLWIRRAIVRGHVDAVKTRYSAKPMPLNPALEKVLLSWRGISEFTGESDWMWASPAMGGSKPLAYTSLLELIQAAGKKAGLEGVAWHTFRHSYRTWLSEAGTPIEVQQKLMRHSDIRTTMNIYGDTISETLRKAHDKVVTMGLRTA